MRLPVRVGLCVLSGVLMFLSCADFDVWPLAWFGLVPMLLVVLDEKNDSPFRWGWFAGMVGQGGGFYWINGLLQRFGHMPLVASLPLYLLLCAYQGLSWGLFAWVLRRLKDGLPATTGPSLPTLLLAPVVMCAVELVVPFVFPWYLAITQAWVVPVIQIAEITGPIGVSFVIVLVNAAVYELVAARLHRAPLPWRRAAIAACVLVATVGYGLIRMRQVDARRAAAPKVKIGLVQANIGINEKWVPGLREKNLAIHQRLSAELEQKGAQLIVWPESSYPYAFSREQTSDFDDRRRVHQGFTAPILFGAVTVGHDSPFPFNSALMMDERGQIVGRFDKNFLMVFGEYVPFYDQLAWLRKLIPEMSNFSRGEDVTTLPFKEWRLGPLICYEDIIPSFGRRLVEKRPHLLVNITNDAWFGATSEPYEHLALSVFRAVEHRLDLVRAVNTGVSAFVDANGRVVRKSPSVDPDLVPDARPAPLLEEAAMMDPGGLYGALGEWFGVANLLLLLLLGVWALRRAGRPIDWGEVGVGAAVVGAATVLGGAIGGGAGHLGAVLALLWHRPSEAGGWAVIGLIAGGAIGSLAAGVVLRRRIVTSRPLLEAAIASTAVLVVPALVFGRTEGNTGALVFTTLGAAAMAALGLRLARRWQPPPAAAAPIAPPPEEPAAPESPAAARRERKRKRRLTR